MTDVSPSDAVTDDEVNSDPTDPDADADDSGTSITDMLMSTEPDESPDSYDTDNTIAHTIIGGKKMANGAGASIKSGTTALENFIMAGIGFFTGGSDESDEQAPEPEGRDAV